MLAALLVAALVGAVLSTAALFFPLPTHIGSRTGRWPWVRRLLLSVVATALATVIVAAILVFLGVTRRNIESAAIALAISSVIWIPLTRRWIARAHLCWSWSTFTFVAYLAFMLDWTFSAGLPWPSIAAGVVVWMLEVVAALLGCAYLWEMCDVLGSQEWRRQASHRTIDTRPDDQLPMVSFHVPAHNEPPGMVIETLAALKRMDYPSYEIVLIDDNTDDEALWRPVESWCAANDVKFVHLQDWPGYKSGALNYALQHMTDERAELIAVVDSDYQIQPHFLRSTVPALDDPKVAFIQAPQDYREWDVAPYFRRLYFSYQYFFAVSQPSRNERDGAIFAGTMGLIRRKAIEDVGGWDEWCITEDAELSLRLLRAGWSGLHEHESFGQGVMPLTFEALKGQRFRWCFGGIQILRRNWRDLLPGPGTQENRLTAGQRWAYLSGALQWYGDLLALVFFVLLLGGAFNVGLGGDLIVRKLTGFLVAAIPMLMGIGLLRAIALLRRGTGATWRESIGAFMIWQATSLVVARASVLGLFAKEAAFLRTPKTAEHPRIRDAFLANRAETALAVLGVLGIALALRHPNSYGAIVVALLLVWPTVAYASAPANSLAARRAVLSPDLVERQRVHDRESNVASFTTASATLVGIAAASVAIIALAAVPARTPILQPEVLGPARGQPPGTFGGPDVSDGGNAPASDLAGGSSPSPTPTPGVTQGSGSGAAVPGPSRPPGSVPSSPFGTPTPTPTPTPTVSTPSPSPSVTVTPTPTPTLTPTPTISPTLTPTPTPSATVTVP